MGERIDNVWELAKRSVSFPWLEKSEMREEQFFDAIEQLFTGCLSFGIQD